VTSTVRTAPERGRDTRRIDDGAGFAVDRVRMRVGARPGLIAAGLVVLLAIPLVVALVVLKHPRWYPLWDLATTEMQLRDVGTRHTPLTGVGGVLGLPDDLQGSHPGPLGLYVMWPVYRLVGSSSWAMQAAAAGVNIAALGVVLWLVSRRKSVGLLLGTTAALALLTHTYGPEALTQAWAPYMPLMWWGVLLAASWCVLSDDLPVLPVAVFAACFCVQSHVSLLIPAVGLVTLVFAGVWLAAYRHHDDRSSLRRTAKWSLLALGVGVAAWFPPILEQLTSDRGNLAILWRQFRDWNQDPMGVRNAFELLLIYLNPWRLVTRDMFVDTYRIAGSRLPGTFVLIAWTATAIIAVKLRNRLLVRLHAVVAAALVLAVVAVSRLEVAWWYRIQWLWGIAVLVLTAIAATLTLLVRRNLEATKRERTANRLVWVPLAVVVAFTVAFAASAAGVDYDRRDSAVLGELVPQVVSSLEDDYPRSSQYLLVLDETATGAYARGLMNELVRRGLEVGALERYRAEVRPHRVVSPREADAVIAVALGTEIDTWRATPGARQIARVVPDSHEATSSDDELGLAVFVAPPRVLRGR
jgi:hypothetical protein